MKVRTVQGKSNRLNLDFEIVSKIGEGSFGEAFKVFSKTDGCYYAIKKAK
jgi:serine/threonine protein kinase